MADKPVTVEVPEDRVPEFYLWFAAFLASAPGRRAPGAAARVAEASAIAATTRTVAPGATVTWRTRAGSTAGSPTRPASSSTC